MYVSKNGSNKRDTPGFDFLIENKIKEARNLILYCNVHDCEVEKLLSVSGKIVRMEDNTEVNDVFVQKGQLPLSAQSAYSAIPTSRNSPRQLTYFNNEKKASEGSTYNRLFNWKDGFNNKLHRCDREHAKSRGLNVHEEEFSKPIPSLMSTRCGLKLDWHVDHPDRKHVRIIKTREFLSNNGITFTPEQGYGNVIPS